MVAVLAVVAGVAWWTLGRNERSVEAFCRTWSHELTRLTGNVDLSGQNPLVALSGGLAVIDQLPDSLDRVARVAPSEIERDVSDLRDAARRMRDSTRDAGRDPLSMIAAAGEAALANSGPALRVGQYVSAHCSGG